jgi:DNA-binding beta-propeller fold protein YncE
VVVGLDRRVYVSDGVRNQVLVFDPKTHAAQPLGGPGQARLVTPLGLGLDGVGNVYVADQGGKRAVAFAPGNVFLRSYGSADVLLNPVDVAVDGKAGVVYVADSFLHQVLVFRQSDGMLLRRIGRNVGNMSAKQRSAAAVTSSHGRTAAAVPAASATPGHEAGRSSEPRDVVANRGVAAGEFRYPSFIAVGPNGALYVTDALNSRVQVFDSDGRFVRQVGQLGDGPGSFARPKGVALDSEGHIYVVDAAFNNVQIFDEQGRLLLAFAQMGYGEGDLNLPLGLFIDQFDRIYVADRTNNRLQIFEYLRPDGK